MPVFAFQLGHQPHISRAEIFSVLNVYTIVYKILPDYGQFLFLEIKAAFSPIKFIKILGGTIKIIENLELPDLKENTIADYLNTTIPAGKINFSISGLNAERLAIAVKKKLKEHDRTVRYITPKNTATILHNDLVKTESDITIVYNSVYITRAIQPIEEFSERDYGRPQSDAKSGMLPPKLARILINLAYISETKQKQVTILDPFCGSGTILLEALDLGYENIFGSDISTQAIADTKKNIDWLKKQKNIFFSPKIFLASATDLQTTLPHKSIDAIITEPYLGKPLRGHETKPYLMTQTQELKELYTQTFGSFQKILKPDGIVIFVIPEFKFKNDWITVDCLSMIKKIGFQIIPFSKNEESLFYARPGQLVGRRIWKLKKSTA